MTGSNPPDDSGPPQGNRPNETQWWSQPVPPPQQPTSGADPTVMRGGAPGQPVTGTDPTVLGAGFDAYHNAAQQNYQQPPPPPYPAPNPYAQQPNYAQPQFPNQPVYAPPPKKKSNAPLIIAGVICLVVVVGIVIALVAVSSGSKGTGNSGTSGGKSGDYSMAKVSDACSLIEPAVLSQWAANPKGSPTHTETQPTSYSGGSLRCQLSNKGGEDDTDSADMDLDGDFLSKYGSPEYNSWKDTDTRTTGSGRSSGALTGVGDEGYYAIEQTNYSSFVQYDYTCATKASNVSLKVRISLTVSGASTGTVASTCKDQLSKALGALKK